MQGRARTSRLDLDGGAVGRRDVMDDVACHGQAQHDVDGKAILAVLLEQGELLGPG